MTSLYVPGVSFLTNLPLVVFNVILYESFCPTTPMSFVAPELCANAEAERAAAMAIAAMRRQGTTRRLFIRDSLVGHRSSELRGARDLGFRAWSLGLRLT